MRLRCCRLFPMLHLDTPSRPALWGIGGDNSLSSPNSGVNHGRLFETLFLNSYAHYEKPLSTNAFYLSVSQSERRGGERDAWRCGVYTPGASVWEVA